MDLFPVLRSGPFRDSGDLGGVHLDVVVGDDDSKVLDPSLFKLAFLCSEVEFVGPEYFHDTSENFSVGLQVTGKNEDVI